jgi:hypothetical protein
MHEGSLTKRFCKSDFLVNLGKSLLDGVHAQINSLPLSRDGLCERRLPNSRQSPKDDQHCLVIEYNLDVQRVKRAAGLPVADVTSFACILST